MPTLLGYKQVELLPLQGRLQPQEYILSLCCCTHKQYANSQKIPIFLQKNLLQATYYKIKSMK